MRVRRSLEEVRAEFVGKPYSKEAAARINGDGYGFTTSSASGKIKKVYEPKIPNVDQDH